MEKLTRIAPEDIPKVLQLAAELYAKDQAQIARVEECQQIAAAAAEVGLPPEYLERAAAALVASRQVPVRPRSRPFAPPAALGLALAVPLLMFAWLSARLGVQTEFAPPPPAFATPIAPAPPAPPAPPVLAPTGGNLSGASLPGAKLAGQNLSGAYMKGANLAQADLRGTDLSRAYLGGANLAGAKLAHANLSHAYLKGADLGQADLAGADLSRAYLSGANLRGANLTGTTLMGAYLKGADLTGAIYDRPAPED